MDPITEPARAARNAYQRQYRKQHQEKGRAYLKEWRQSHPEKIKEYNARYWARVAQKSDATVKRNSVTNQTICQECGKVFTAKRSTARFCSAVCRVNFNRNTKSSKNGN